MKNMSSTADISHARDNLSRDFQSLVDHAEQLLQATTSLKNEGVDLARHKLNESLEQVKAQIGPMRDAAVERSRLAMDASVRYAREKPRQAAAIVCLAALTIGFISHLGSSRS